MEGLVDNIWSITARDCCDFTFAFDNCSFSDRILRMELQELGAEDGGGPQSMFQKAVNMAQESSSNAIMSNDLNATGVRVIHINSLLLAKRSLFFYKLFSNGMRETMKKEVTVQITSSEEYAFMKLLKSMYCGTLVAMSTKELLDIIILAYRFEVMSCIDQCAIALRRQPMSHKFATLLLCLPWGTDAMQLFYKAAKEQLLNNFCYDEKCEEEYMKFSINVIQELLSSDQLTVPSEDYIFDFVMKLAKQNYNKEDERREVLGKKLVKLLRFSHMTKSKLSQILANKDLHCANVSELVSEALLFKAGHSSLTYSDEDRFYPRFYAVTVSTQFHKPPEPYEVYVHCKFNVHKSQRSEPFSKLGKEFSLVSRCSCGSTWSEAWGWRWSWELFLETMDDGDFSLQCESSLETLPWSPSNIKQTYKSQTLDFGRGRKLILKDMFHDYNDDRVYYGGINCGGIFSLALHVNGVTGNEVYFK